MTGLALVFARAILFGQESKRREIMSDTGADEKIMGIVPKNRYVYFAYMFLLVSAAGNVLYSLLAIVGLSLESAGYAVMILGLLSLILAVIGLTKHKGDFSAHDHAHFKYMGALFVAFFIAYILFGGLYEVAHVLGYLGTAALGALQSLLAWTGYNSWQDGRIITKDNIKEEVQLAIAKR